MASTLVVVLVLVFDIIAFGLAIGAEQRRNTAFMMSDKEQNYTYCVYDSDIATGLAAGAMLFLLLSQILVMAASRCFCCGRGLRPGGSRACALLLFLFCWLTFVIAELCLLAGSVRNAYHTGYRQFQADGTLSCQTLRKGIFAAGAAFIFFTAILSEFYYLAYSKANVSNAVPYASNIGMTPYS